MINAAAQLHKVPHFGPFRKIVFLDKSVLKMSETSLSSLHKKITPWVSGIATNSTTAVWIGDAKPV
jgi:hypothetical protein